MVSHHRAEVEAFPYIAFPLSVGYKFSKIVQRELQNQFYYLNYGLCISILFLLDHSSIGKKSRNEEEILLIEPMLCVTLLSFLNNQWLTGQLNTV